MLTLRDEIKKYTPAIRLERVLSRKTMSALRGFTLFGTLFGAATTFTVWYFAHNTYEQQLLGLTLVFTALWLEQILLYAYHNSFYFRNLDSIIQLEDKTIVGATYDVAQAIMRYQDDVTLAFCTSTFGANILMRSGLNYNEIDEFLQSIRQKITADMVILPEGEVFSLIGLGQYLLTHDTQFANLFKQHGIQEKVFLGTLRWIVGTYQLEKRTDRWWSKDNLSKTTGLGLDWSYGTTFMLEKYSRSINTSAVFSTMTRDSSFAKEKIADIETALARAQGANVLLIGEAGVGQIDLVMEVKRRMSTGESIQSITGKQIIVLDTNRLFAINQSKQEVEITFLKLFSEAVNAGNIILVIENLSSVLREAEATGVILPQLLDEFLATTELHVIATDTPHNYHDYLEPLGAFARRFVEILIDSPDLSATIRVLQPVALANEISQRVIFTYSSLEAIAAAADRFIVEGVMPDKAIQLLVDVASEARVRDAVIINTDFVYGFVSAKTSIPVGPIKEEERELLLHLEDTLHRQVIGQERAIDAIARTMRRARAGIQSSDKPIGSFLFLGPTGVGKTETAKALAKIFFGSEDKMQRLDMSEYSGGDALYRLIGDGQSSGELPDRLREHPYCVLLLDEFEKAAQPVHDLFLQILDEGIFTDSRGDKVNARNTIIIATSNAGSQLILRTVQQRKELTHLTQEIINSIIESGIFRPELINRFDSTIIFEPLTIGEQGQVASLMLGGLYKRIKEQGYDLQVESDLLNVLVEKGYSPEFGARPMQRVLQDMVEEKVAKKIIGGEVVRGQVISLSRSDFSEEEIASV
jgi:ATP-dependent Clp protease ATP-binding subunit ClpC